MKEFDIKDGVLKKYKEIEGKTNVIVPEGVTQIDPVAFEYCTNLTSIKIPGSVTIIGDFAFNWCEKLKTIHIPNSLIKIGSYAFYECQSLTNMTIPSSVTQIEDGTFCGCENLTSINIPDSLLKIGYNVFFACDNLINVNTSEQVFAKFKYDDQYLIVSNFARQYYSNNIYTKNEINKYKNFIMIAKEKILLLKNNSINEKIIYAWPESKEEKIKKYIISIIQNKELLNFMCNNMENAFTVKELDELIKVSVEIGEVETTALLMDYKNNLFEFQKPLDNDNFNLEYYSKEELEKIEEKEKTKKKTDNKNRKA